MIENGDELWGMSDSPAQPRKVVSAARQRSSELDTRISMAQITAWAPRVPSFAPLRCRYNLYNHLLPPGGLNLSP